MSQETFRKTYSFAQAAIFLVSWAILGPVAIYLFFTEIPGDLLNVIIVFGAAWVLVGIGIALLPFIMLWMSAVESKNKFIKAIPIAIIALFAFAILGGIGLAAYGGLTSGDWESRIYGIFFLLWFLFAVYKSIRDFI